MSEILDRRSFLGAAAAAGAVAAAAATPIAARALDLAGHYAASSGAEPLREPELHGESAEAEWHIDDMWGHAPRYAHPIPYSPMRTSPIAWEHVDPIDRFLVI